jgi:hypothetical protein
VDTGKNKGYPDADLVEKNIHKGLIILTKEAVLNHVKGDQALITTFKKGQYASVATDDSKLIRVLRAAGIPFILPALLIYAIYKKGMIDQATGLKWLDRLSAFINDEEYSITKLLLEEKS